MEEKELYIHIPFCVRKCNYCDFLSFSSGEDERYIYVEALCQEIRESAALAFHDSIRSVFIGGGTPSILRPDQMDRIMGEVHKNYRLIPGAEVSMESNPGTLNRDKLMAYHSMGINRLSMGLQSTEDECLKKLGRIHSFAQFLDNYEEARRAGFDNINIDIMSALPGQTLSSYKNTLELVTGLKPEHISSYSLILEEGTPFYEDDDLLDLLPNEEEERKMYEMTGEILKSNGYERYEISNYALEGRECVHNLGYWDNVPYLGLGLGASSYWNKCRFSNETDLNKYLQSPFVCPEERESYSRLSRQEEMEEYMFLGLRKMRGVSLIQFQNNFGCSMDSVYHDVICRYVEAGYLKLDKGQLSLTSKGIDVSNRILADFLLN